MFGLSFWHIAVMAVIGFLLFGGRLADLMGAAGKSLRSEDTAMIDSRLMFPFLQRIVRMLYK